MGTWGYGPYQNDSAVDWLADNVRERATKGLESKTPEEVRVAAALLVEYLSKHQNVEDEAALAIERLEDLLESSWLDAWSDPAAAKREIRKQIRALKKLV